MATTTSLQNQLGGTAVFDYKVDDAPSRVSAADDSMHFQKEDQVCVEYHFQVRMTRSTEFDPTSMQH